VRVEDGSVNLEGTEAGAGARLRSARLVVAAGAWSGAIAGLPALPVRPVRGQMLRLGGAAWPWRGSLRLRHNYVVRRGPDGLLVGATVEEAGFAEHPTAAGICGLLDFARTLFPRLAAAPVESIWAGLRPGSPDGRPILGMVGEGPIVAACGHYRNGILLAPWTGRVIADLIAGGTPLESAELFSPARPPRRVVERVRPSR
jgi:glycine oxidase